MSAGTEVSHPDTPRLCTLSLKSPCITATLNTITCSLAPVQCAEPQQRLRFTKPYVD